MPSCFLVISWTKKRHREWQATGPACWKLSLTRTVYIIYSPHLFLPAEYQHVEGVVKTSESVCWPNSRAKKWPKNQLKSHIFCVWKDYTIIRKQQWTLLINPHGGIIHRGISIFSHWQDVNTQCLSWENKGWKKLTAASGSQDFFACNEFSVSLWIFFFLMRIGDFKSASFSYHISSQISLLSSSRNMQEGRKEALGCLLHSAANLSWKTEFSGQLRK